MYVLAYVGAAIAEIAGCFSFWAWLRLGKSVWWLVPGMASLAAFAYLLTLADVAAAGSGPQRGDVVGEQRLPRGVPELLGRRRQARVHVRQLLQDE